MTGGGFGLPSHDDDFSDGEDGDVRLELTELGHASHRRAVEWVGKPSVVGPEWMRMPLLTVGMLGLQCVWSIEMGYASPYLLELGLSKSLMSLVFVAGPLSGLIVQPLIGVFADRSKSRFGRRRPFMLAGCALSACAIMLLGWSREVSHLLGGGQIFAIWIAVFAIYCIDFSINAVQAVDRALIVDTVPPSQQEKGNAWAGRMLSAGSLSGFYVGNIDLVSIFSFLGHTQLQVLSFLTSTMLMLSHGLTAYSVKERVLLRDNRKQSQTSAWGTITSIWSNLFTLPPAIRSICFAQFFAWIGWFPILFFTSVWVGEIYTREAIANGADPNDPNLPTDATRAGSRALFLNALINMITSVFLPFLVHSSGIRSGDTVPNSAAIKRQDEGARGRWGMFDSRSWVGRIMDRRPAWMHVQVPIPGLTLIKVWILAQAIFCVDMLCTWFVSSVFWANVVISIVGFCWAVSQWAPFSLLGELILLDREPSRGKHVSRTMADTPVIREPGFGGDDARLSVALQEHEEEEALMRSAHDNTIPIHLNTDLADHSRGSSLSLPGSRQRTPLASRRTSEDVNAELTPRPLAISTHQAASDKSAAHGNAARHSLEERSRGSSSFEKLRSKPGKLSLSDDDDGDDIAVYTNGNGFSDDAAKEPAPRPRKSEGTAEKAGVILGIHNIFVVLPQFLVTFLSSIIFYLMEPTRDALPEHHPGPGLPAPGANSTGIGEIIGDLVRRTPELHVTSGSDSVGLIFRIGGISSAVAAYLCWRMSRDWSRG